MRVPYSPAIVRSIIGIIYLYIGIGKIPDAVGHLNSSGCIPVFNPRVPQIVSILETANDQ